MRVLLLAAGLGTRLRPITDSTPKCLVPINGKPLLEIWLERLTNAGMGPFLVNTHYLHHQVDQFLETSKFRDMVELVYEPKLLGTAGTLLKNIDFFKGEAGMLIHADNYCLANLREFKQKHISTNREIDFTMMTFSTDNPKNCGIVELDSEGFVTKFLEKPEIVASKLANGAVYILSRKFIQDFNQRFPNAKDFSIDVIPGCIGNIKTYFTNKILIDIGTPQALKKCDPIAYENLDIKH
jgi:mannose-1-phosphate guanylyltransferase